VDSEIRRIASGNAGVAAAISECTGVDLLTKEVKPPKLLEYSAISCKCLAGVRESDQMNPRQTDCQTLQNLVQVSDCGTDESARSSG